MAGDEPTIMYFRLRGRVEMVKVAFAIAGQAFRFEEVERAQLKSDFDTFPFGQVPILKVGGACIPQSMAQLRYVGRAHQLYGSSNLEATMIDALLDGLRDLSMKLRPVLRTPETERDQAKAVFWAAHVDPASKAQQNGGAHFAFIEGLINKHGNGFAIGSNPSIADAALFSRLEIITLVFGDTWRALFPALASITNRVGEIPSVQAYMASNQRLPNLAL